MTAAATMKEEHMPEKAKEIQAYDTITPNVPIDLSIEIREEIVRNLNQTLADSMTLRDLYKKCHWQVSGATFYPLHRLFDKHHAEQSDFQTQLGQTASCDRRAASCFPEKLLREGFFTRLRPRRKAAQDQIYKKIADDDCIPFFLRRHG